MENLSVAGILHVIGQGLNVPCMVVLIILLIATVWQFGDIVVEWILERRKVKEDVPELLKRLNGMSTEEMKKEIEGAKILKRQKKMFMEMIDAGNAMDDNARSAFTQKLLDDESAFYDSCNNIADIIQKIGPMFGLLGTLIPLGPGIVALGEGDTETLSESLAIAFDTTIAGMIAAAICYVISNARRRWYDSDMSASEAVSEIILENQALAEQGADKKSKPASKEA